MEMYLSRDVYDVPNIALLFLILEVLVSNFDPKTGFLLSWFSSLRADAGIVSYNRARPASFLILSNSSSIIMPSFDVA
jgi:hypothetical protein